MSLQKSQTNNIKSIFNGNRFMIPEYQRKYSWTKNEREELWNDILESIGTMNHFIGTLSFKKSETDDFSTDELYDVIDGQQRLTTLYILLSVLIDKISDHGIREKWHANLIGSVENLKLTPLGEDGTLLGKVIFDYNNIDETDLVTKSQRQMYSAKREFIALTSSLDEDKEVMKHIKYVVENIEILVFNVENEAQAVKMFSVINDRGLPLNIIDKTKSTLMYFSTISLDEALNHEINLAFGEIYDAFDAIDLVRDELDVLKQFTESTLYTQHYYSARKLFPKEWNYKIGADEIFRSLKRICKSLENKPDELKTFISDYTKDFQSFSIAYRDLLEEVKTNPAYAKPFRYLGFTATMYPCIVRIYQKGMLDELMELLEKIEVRVYKLKGTNPRWNMYDLSSKLVESDMNVEQVKQEMMNFLDSFMNDYLFKTYLQENIYRNASVKYILYEFNREELPIEKYSSLQKEHIFCQSPTFDVVEYGFENRDTYDYEKDRLGNIILLEKDLNKENDNDPPKAKTKNYLDSSLTKTRDMGGHIEMNDIDKSYLDTRRDQIIDFCLERFAYTKVEAYEEM